MQDENSSEVKHSEEIEENKQCTEINEYQCEPMP